MHRSSPSLSLTRPPDTCILTHHPRKTTRNASSILTAIGKASSIPVYLGASQPLHRNPIHSPTDIHGESGIDGTHLLPEPTVSPDLSVPAVEAMYAALMSCAPGTAWVVATGAFTNAAALFQTHPDLIAHIAGLSLMGGAVGGGFTPAPLGVVQGVPRIGNWTQYAEFNILADPEAAAWLFDTKSLACKTTLIPLDVTHLVPATEEVQKLLLWGKEGGVTHAGEGLENAALGAKSTLRLMLVELLFYFAKTYRWVAFHSLKICGEAEIFDVLTDDIGMYSVSLLDRHYMIHWL
jgi:uridine nucleosidase